MGAWIETQPVYADLLLDVSHPIWVRGLKRTPWHWHISVCRVAPYMGAWIETI